MRLSYELHIALRYLLFHRGRTFLSIITLISVGGVAVGTAALVVALSLMTGFELDVRERILSGSADLTVMSAVAATIDDPAPLVDKLAGTPKIRAAAPVLYTQAMLTSPLSSSPSYAEIKGVDPRRQPAVLGEGGAGAAAVAALAQPTDSGRDGIVLGEQLALDLAVLPGEVVRLFVPSVSLTPLGPAPRSHVFEVVGTYDSEHFQEDSQRAYVELAVLQRMLRAAEGVSWVELRLQDLADLEPMKLALAGELGSEWAVVDLLEANRDMIRALNTEKLTLFLAIGLIVVVAALNIVSTLILMVTDKIKEIGTLSALGARRGGIALVFVLQGLTIGVVGTTCGLIVGAAASYWMDRYELIKLNPEVYYLTHVPFVTRPVDVVAIGVVALIISFAATVYPAWKAATLDPVEALRYE